MKVKELIAKLQELNDEQKELGITCQSGTCSIDTVEDYGNVINLD